MSLNTWVLIYIVDLIFWLWIIKFDGAERLGDSFISGIFTFCITLKWNELSADGIRVLLTVVFISHSFFFVLGLTVPAFRAMLG